MGTAGEMGSLDEALSAMLSNDHGQYSSLANVMTSSNSPCAGTGDLFASQYSSLHDRPGHGVAATSTTRTSTYMADAEWPFPREEKWVLDAKRESVQVSSGLASGHGHVPPSGGLQRYHSAPSSFLQCLADFNVDTFSQVPDSPLGDIGEATLLNSFLAENLAPIHEKGSQPMDTGKPDASPSLNDYERFFLSQNDFGRNGAYISPSGKSEPRPPSTLQDHSHSGVHSTPDSLGVRSRPTRSKILRQSSSPADFLAAVHDHMDESKSPIFKTPSFLPTDENMTSPNPEENAAGRLGHGSRVLETDFPGWLGSSSPKGPKLGGLIRHSSLPVASRPFSPPRDLDDLADLGAVPFKTRAGRGFATHPRSIAERVRRTKISERMKKLQDLVPNMDRQTNTADMLDEAVEYVKQLQLQVQELSNTVVQLKESLAHCT